MKISFDFPIGEVVRIVEREVLFMVLQDILVQDGTLAL